MKLCVYGVQFTFYEGAAEMQPSEKCYLTVCILVEPRVINQNFFGLPVHKNFESTATEPHLAISCLT